MDSEASTGEGKGMDSETRHIARLLRMNVEELDLSVRSSNCFRAKGIKTLAELVQNTEQEMLAYRNFHQKCLYEVRDALSELGLRFGMDIAPYLHHMEDDEEDEETEEDESNVLRFPARHVPAEDESESDSKGETDKGMVQDTGRESGSSGDQNEEKEEIRVTPFSESMLDEVRKIIAGLDEDVWRKAENESSECCSDKSEDVPEEEQ